MSATTRIHRAAPTATAEHAFQRGVDALRCGALDAADAAFADCLRETPAHASARLGLAMVLAARGQMTAASESLRALLADVPAFAAVERVLTDWLRDSDPIEAGQRFTRCARRDPTDHDAIGNALQLAARLQREGRVAPPSPPPLLAAAPAQVSVVICSIRPAMLSRARESLAGAFGGAAWELVHVHDARSLCEGWNRGLARARGDIVVFCHDDIALACERLAERLAGALSRDDVVGVAGSTRLTGPNWIWAGAKHARGWVTHVRGDELLAGAYALEGPDVGGIEVLDGVFIAARRDAALAIGFDAEAFDGWHLYDVDFCWRARRAGLRIGVRYDLGLVHWSEGGFDAAWQRYANRFLQRAGLPEAPMPQVPGAAVPVASIEALPGMHAWLAHWIANA